MATPNASTSPESQMQYWRRVLRPLGWWSLLALVLFGIHQHKLAMERTRLNFTVTLAGQAPYPEATVTFDGQPIVTGQKIPLGTHQFSITHPKGDAYATNFFIWYGAHNLGTIDLKRTMSTLAVTVNPPAPLLCVHGPEFNVTLTNSPGMTSSVPTDQYVILSRYAHWSRSDDVSVTRGAPTAWQITPHLGAAQITCNEADATGQFMQADGQLIESVNFPYSIWELPEGTYQVTAQHHNDTLSQKFNITAGTTNQLALEFLYGTAVLETEPPGAAVQTVDGRYWGMTPLTVNELKPGDWTFMLQHEGYETVAAPLTITAYQSSSFHTNLISVNYTGSMKKARQAMDDENYDAALKSVGEALIAKPGDAEASALQQNATGLGSLQRAKQLGLQGDFIGGQEKLATTLQIFPDNTEAKALVAEFKRREPEQRERLRLERLEHGNLAFKKAFRYNSDADLFPSHEFKTTKPVDQVYAAIMGALRIPPSFQITKNYSPLPETYQIEFRQDFSTYLATSAGYRNGVIVCAQTKDDETQILFKLLEYKAEAQIKFSIGNLIGTPMAVNYVPISPARLGQLSDKLQARLTEGVSNVTARIEGAIGQTLPASTQ
jgi:PEGA domain